MGKTIRPDNTTLWDNGLRSDREKYRAIDLFWVSKGRVVMRIITRNPQIAANIHKALDRAGIQCHYESDSTKPGSNCMVTVLDRQRPSLRNPTNPNPENAGKNDPVALPEGQLQKRFAIAVDVLENGRFIDDGLAKLVRDDLPEAFERLTRRRSEEALFRLSSYMGL